MTFEDLGLSPEILQAVADAGYETPTPIQEQAIPYVLMGRDVLGCAQTGTGKTASFTLPMIDILSTGRARARMPRSLIITPTRELASQIADNFEVYGKHNKLNMALLIGGVSFDEQISKLDRGVDVLIATPGRLLDHFERGRILLTDIKILVIDEADRMMDMGFMPDVERIVSLLPKIRTTLFFSATMAPEIRRIADKFLMNPKEIIVSPEHSTAETVTQSLVVVSSDPWMKRDVLRRLITTEPVENALVFCNRKRDVDILNKSLIKHGFNSAALHGDMSQPARLETLQAFRDGKTQILVASDVAARGLDMPKVSHVFNFDVPNHAEDYVHRIGRTGRAGRAGRAHMIATPEDGVYLDAVIKFIGNEIEQIDVEGVESASMSDAPPRRGRGGPRRTAKGPAKGPSKRPSKRPAAAKRSAPEPESASSITESASSITESASSITESAPVETPKTEAAAPVARKSEEPKIEKPNKRTPNKKSPPRERKIEEPVLGLGPNAPAFFLRPVRSQSD